MSTIATNNAIFRCGRDFDLILGLTCMNIGLDN